MWKGGIKIHGLSPRARCRRGCRRPLRGRACHGCLMMSCSPFCGPTRPHLNGTAGMTRTRSDWAISGKLAYYCARDEAQMERLFSRLRPVKRPKDLRRTLRNSAKKQRRVFDPARPRRKRSTRPPGRPLSDFTRAVIDLADAGPKLTAAGIARELGARADAVRQVLCRHRRAGTACEMAA
jgi:hypothetical protein